MSNNLLSWVAQMTRQKTILIVDDDPSIRHLLEMTVSTEPYNIVVASDGEEAIELARLHQPDIVLLDVIMPKMDGYEVCEQLKRDPATEGVVVILLTAKAQREDRLRGAAAGADGYIAKPFSPQSLRTSLAQHLSL